MKSTHGIRIVLVFLCLSLSVLGSTTDQKNSKEAITFLSGNSQCGDSEVIDTSHTYTDTINFMGHWYSEDKREDFVREWVRDYQKAHPNVYVNMKFSHEIVGGKSKVKTAWFINEMIMFQNYTWDIVWMDDNIYQLVTENQSDINLGKEYLVDFSGNEKFVKAHKDMILNDSTYKNLTGGQLIGPMIEGFYVLLWYNKPLADRIGLNIKSRGMSYEDLLGYFKEINLYNLEHNTSYAALYESYDWRSTGQFLFQQLFNSVLSEEKGTSPQKSEEEIKNIALFKTLKAFEEMGKYKPLISSHSENQWFNTRDYILNDSCVFYLGGSWMYSHWNSLDSIKMNNKIKAAELPVFKSSDSYLGGYIPTWGILKNSPNRERAVDFLLFVCQPKYADKWIQYTHTPTGLKGSIDLKTDKVVDNEDINQYLERIYGKNIKFYADTKYIFRDEQNITQNTFYEVLIDILSGEKTAQEAFDDFKIMDEY